MMQAHRGLPSDENSNCRKKHLKHGSAFQGHFIKAKMIFYELYGCYIYNINYF